MLNKLKEKYPNNLFIKIIANKRIRSIIFLLMWFVFMIVVYFLVIVPLKDYTAPSNVTKNETVKKDLFNTMKENLLKNNYSFEAKVNGIKYTGKVLYEKMVLYKDDNNEVVKLYKEEDKLYIVKDNTLENILNDEYLDTYLNPSYFYDKFNESSFIKDNNSYIFQNDTFYVKIEVINDNNYHFYIKDDLIEYDILFTNIGLIKDISYN